MAADEMDEEEDFEVPTLSNDEFFDTSPSVQRFEQPPEHQELECYKVTYEWPGGSTATIVVYTPADEEDPLNFYEQLEQDKFVAGYQGVNDKRIHGISTSRIISFAEIRITELMR